jgi:hypothetical protein
MDMGIVAEKARFMQGTAWQDAGDEEDRVCLIPLDQVNFIARATLSALPLNLLPYFPPVVRHSVAFLIHAHLIHKGPWL